jgi:hypothetical protein
MFILPQSHLCLETPPVHESYISFGRKDSTGRRWDYLQEGVYPIGRFNHEESSSHITCTYMIAVAPVVKFLTPLEERKDEVIWSATHLASAVFGGVRSEVRIYLDCEQFLIFLYS